MSSESNGRRPESPAGGSAAASAARTGVRAPSAWGPPRDALAAVRNLEALLRSSAVTRKTIVDLAPELRSSAAVLRDVVSAVHGRGDVKSEVGAYGVARALELGALLDAVELGRADRDHLAGTAGTLADELEAVVDLLALLDLAETPLPTEIGLDFVAREAGRTSGVARDREVVVRFDGASPDRAVFVDPCALGALLGLLVACVQSCGSKGLVLRARAAGRARFIVEPSTVADERLPTLTLRVMAHIAPAGRVARRVAERLGATLELSDGRGCIVFGFPPDD
jgi:hypothetical protein